MIILFLRNNIIKRFLPRTNENGSEHCIRFIRLHSNLIQLESPKAFLSWQIVASHNERERRGRSRSENVARKRADFAINRRWYQ